jgi:hypothetical protein
MTINIGGKRMCAELSEEMHRRISKYAEQLAGDDLEGFTDILTIGFDIVLDASNEYDEDFYVSLACEMMRLEYRKVSYTN